MSRAGSKSQTPGDRHVPFFRHRAPGSSRSRPDNRQRHSNAGHRAWALAGAGRRRTGATSRRGRRVRRNIRAAIRRHRPVRSDASGHLTRGHLIVPHVDQDGVAGGHGRRFGDSRRQQRRVRREVRRAGQSRSAQSVVDGRTVGRRRDQGLRNRRRHARPARRDVRRSWRASSMERRDRCHAVGVRPLVGWRHGHRSVRAFNQRQQRAPGRACTAGSRGRWALERAAGRGSCGRSPPPGVPDRGVRAPARALDACRGRHMARTTSRRRDARRQTANGGPRRRYTRRGARDSRGERASRPLDGSTTWGAPGANGHERRRIGRRRSGHGVPLDARGTRISAHRESGSGARRSAASRIPVGECRGTARRSSDGGRRADRNAGAASGPGNCDGGLSWT